MEFKKVISYKKIFAGIAIVPGCKFLPKQQKSAEKVENPRPVSRKSLPKQQKSAKRVEIPRVTGHISLPK